MRLFTTLLATLMSLALLTEVQAASLKDNIVVYSNVVVAGDLFDGLDEHHDEPLFLAPDIGQSGKISAYRVAEEAHNVGIYDLQLNDIQSVSVTRPSIIVSGDEAKRQLRNHIAKQMSENIDFEITTTSIPARVHTDPRVKPALQISHFELTESGARFHSTLTYAAHNGTRDVAVRGTITEMATVMTLTRDLSRDDVVTAADLIASRLPKTKIRPGSLASLKPAIGMAALRNLAQGSVIRNQDLAKPLLVRANDPVAITYSVPGLILTAQGRALSNGAKDATVSIRNLQSNRVVRGIVTGIGEVLVIPRKPFLAANQQSIQTKVQ